MHRDQTELNFRPEAKVCPWAKRLLGGQPAASEVFLPFSSVGEAQGKRGETGAEEKRDRLQADRRKGRALPKQAVPEQGFF